MDKTVAPSRFPIRVIAETGEAKIYSTSFQSDEHYAEGWKSVLRKARQENKEVLCTCPGQEEKPLSVHYVSVTDKYHLARYPETGHCHSPGCIYHAYDSGELPDDASKDNAQFQHMESGAKFHIRLDIGINKRQASPAKHTLSGKKERLPPSEKNHLPRVSLDSLARLLFSTARLNEWTPNMAGKRTIESVHRWLLKAADEVDAGGTLLSNVMLTSTMDPDSTRANDNAKKTVAASEQNQRLFVIAPLARHRDESEGKSILPIIGFSGIPMMPMDAQTWARLQDKYLPEMEAWRAGRRVLAIVQTDVPTKGKAQVLDIAIFRVSQHWIPVYSDAEETIESKLVEEGRRFSKPLNTIGEERKLPSFWLKDSVVGRDIPLVLIDAQKEVSRATYYSNKYGQDNWWGWDGMRMPPPPFHAKKRQLQN